MAGGGGGSESGEPEFQIAPMIDVLLVLLVFFMSTTTAHVLKVDKDIKLPVSPNATKRDEKMTKHELAINVRWKSGKAIVNVDNNVYPDLNALILYLQERKKANPLLRIVVRGDGDLPAIEIQRIMNVVGEGGIADISFSALSK